MTTNILWKQLLKKATIKRGWHLSRVDMSKDFAELLYSGDVFAKDLDLYSKEIINRIRTETYRPHPLFPVEVPKGSLGFRPGAVISILDRTILSSIVFLIADDIDKRLPESVYSWRLKRPIPKDGPIFQEEKIVDLPYLKKSTIGNVIDPFEPWYTNWPEFDVKSRETFGEDGYRYLVTSDIAAYFENIQLPILRDRLLGYMPNEHKIINLLIYFLESWAPRTQDGRIHLRGIPQGNLISSFIGNMYLLPLDEVFKRYESECDSKYFRYMDDIRIFTKLEEDARRAVFLLEKTLRKLHLNVQTAKTKIYDERKGEISKHLIDERVDRISNIFENIKETYEYKPIPISARKNYIKKLDDIARSDVNQKIIGAKKQLDGLSGRVFRGWVSAHFRINSDGCIDRLIKEIQINPDYRLTRKLIIAARKFPKRKSIETKLLDFLDSRRNIFPHQEAECLRALRYLSRIGDRTKNRCLSNLFKNNADPYLRIQSGYLLSRTIVDDKILNRCIGIFKKEANPYVQSSIANILVQRRVGNAEIIRMLHFHPNEKIRDIGKYFGYIKNDINTARERLKYIFNESIDWVICDNMPYIHLMSISNQNDIKEMLIEYIRKYRNDIGFIGIRDILKMYYKSLTSKQ